VSIAWVVLAALAGCILAAAAPPVDRVILTSPRSSLRLALFVSDGRLSYEVFRRDAKAFEPARAGVVVDGVDLGDGVTMGAVENYRVADEANGARVTVTHLASNVRYGVEIRAYEERAALRTIVPGAGSRVPGSTTMFTLPVGSTVLPRAESALASVVAKLPGDGGYVAIAESAARSYPVRVVKAEGARTYRERLADPVAAVAGTITTPWRVLLAAPDLETLDSLLRRVLLDPE
jgi:hypothetical protein